MFNETDLTERPKTQPEEPSDFSSTHNNVEIGANEANVDDGATRPAPGRQPVTANIL